MQEIKITSPAFKHNSSIPSKYTCDSDEISPPLKIENTPSSAKSLVLLMDDPDVPETVRKDRMWDHWVVFNIPPNTKEIEEGRMPPGIAGKNTSGRLGYQGPCPPDKEHRYFFKVYALDTLLNLEAGASKTDVLKAMEDHIIAKGELIGLYNRKR